MSHISGPTAPLGDTVRIGDLVLEPGGAVNIAGTRMPPGVRLEDCVLGSGPGRALLTKTPEGVVTIERSGKTLAFVWSAPANQWYGPEPRRPTLSLATMLAKRRPALAVLAVLALFWMYSRTKPSPRPTPRLEPSAAEATFDIERSNVAASDMPSGEAGEPFAGLVESLEDQLEEGRLSQEPLVLSDDQVRQFIACYTAQAKAAKLLTEEIRPVQMRVEDVEWVLGSLKDDPNSPFELRRRFARLSDPKAGEILYAMSMGESSLERIAQRADSQAGRLLRGEEGGFTKADIHQAVRDQEALAAAHAILRERHDLVDSLLVDLPFERLKEILSRLWSDDRRQKFVSLYGVPLEATFDERSAELEELFLALDRINPAFLLVDAKDQEITMEMLASHRPPDLFGRRTAADEQAEGEAKRLIGAYASRRAAHPARLSRIARGVDEGRRAARTTFAPLLAD